MTVGTCSCCEKVTDEWVNLWSRQDVVICFECLDYLNGQRSRKLAILGGLTPLVGYDPIFRVVDVDRAVDHYQRLGFTTDYHDETYAFAHWGNLVLHLAQDDQPEEHRTGALYLHVDDADALAARWSEAGMQVTALEDTDYGKREGTHTDPDGNLIRFGGPHRD